MCLVYLYLYRVLCSCVGDDLQDKFLQTCRPKMWGAMTRITGLVDMVDAEQNHPDVDQDPGV